MTEVKEETRTGDGARSPKKVEALQRLLKAHEGQQHVIVLQDYPDPDAISCALAHQRIASAHGIDCEILYSGRISHQENVALVKLLDIEMTRYSAKTDLGQYQGAVFVDNQGTASSVTKPLLEAKVPILIVVDHHEKQELLEPEFSDIRRGYRACATIYTEYLREGLVELDRSEEGDVRLTTALLHGIMSETDNFIRAGEAEYLAGAFLQRHADSGVLRQIMNQMRSRQTMELIQRALENRITENNLTISGIGYLRQEDRDAIPQAADFILTEENVHTAIVYGIVVDERGEEVVVGSLRTSKLTVDPDEFIKEALGQDSTGEYLGGGRRDAGGFQVPLGFLSGSLDDESSELKWEVFDRHIRNKFFRKLDIQPKPAE